MAHAFWEADGTSSDRACTALKKRAAAVANGGISTGLSVVVLAFGKSLVFTVFFRMLMGLVVIGLYHALLLLPVFLSLLPSTVLPAKAKVDRTTVPADDNTLPGDDRAPCSIGPCCDSDKSPDRRE